MLIVLEGCDGVGKTTLADLLSELLDAGVIHSTRETPNDFDYFAGIIEAAKTRNIIADRFFWGQFVYQEAHERKLSAEQLHDLERQLEDTGGKLIYVYAPKKCIKERLGLRGEELSKPLEDILLGYHQCVKAAHCSFISYNTLTGGTEKWLR
jgi:thymidylate kinase